MKILIHDTDEAQRAMVNSAIPIKFAKLLRGKTLPASRIGFSDIVTEGDNKELAGWTLSEREFTIIETKD